MRLGTPPSRVLLLAVIAAACACRAETVAGLTITRDAGVGDANELPTAPPPDGSSATGPDLAPAQADAVGAAAVGDADGAAAVEGGAAGQVDGRVPALIPLERLCD